MTSRERGPPARHTGMTTSRTTPGRAARIGIALAALATLGLATHADAAGTSETIVRSADPGTGQTERISFAPGTDGATRTGVLSPATEDRYVLRAGAGQTMGVQVSSSDVVLSVGVYAPDGTELSAQPNPAFEGRLPATGDYVLVVSGAANFTIDADYTLTVRIPRGNDHVRHDAADPVRTGDRSRHRERHVLRRSGQPLRASRRRGPDDDRERHRGRHGIQRDRARRHDVARRPWRDDLVCAPGDGRLHDRARPAPQRGERRSSSR